MASRQSSTLFATMLGARPARLCLAVQLALAAPALAWAQTAPAADIVFAIAPTTLDQALGQFGTAAKITVAASPALTRGVMTQGLSGRYTPEQGLAQLLAGTGLQAVANPNGEGYQLRRMPQDGAGVSMLAPVAVTGAYDSATTEGSGSYTSGIVTIGKGKQSVKDIPQSVTVVTRQRMDDQNANSLDDVLANSTGMTLYKSPMGGNYVFSRGFRVDTYQFDGVNREFYYPQANSFTSSTVILDRVEIVRGSTGLLQGAGSPSASINLVRKRPLAENQLQVAASAGSWDNYRTDIDATGPLNESGTLRGRAVASYNDRDYFYDVAKSRNTVLYGVLSYDISPSTTITGGVSYEDLRSTPFFHGLPHYTNGDDIGLKRSTSFAQRWNRWDGKQTTAFAELAHRFNQDWSVKLTGNTTHESNDTKYAFTEGAVNPLTGSGPTMYAGIFDFSTHNKALNLDVDGAFEALGRKHSVSFGASVNHLTSKNDFATARLGRVMDVWNPDHDVPEPTDDWLRENAYRGDATIIKMKQTGVYGVGRFRLADPLTLVAGARVSWYENTAHYRDGGERYTDPYKENGVVTPYGGLIYAFNPQWSGYVSYAEIFEPQNALDASGKLLDPMVGKNYEVGVKGELMDGRVNTSLAVFRIDQKNRAQQDLAGICSVGDVCYVSSGKVRSQGVEAEISGEVLPGWQMFAGYTFNTLKFLDDTTVSNTNFGRTFTPKHMLRLWSDYRLPGELSAWTLGAGVNYQTGSYTETRGVRVSQSSYAVWNARVSYKINKNWTAALNINNLFDKTYYQTIGAPGWGSFYGDPRNATLTVRGTF
ncbi:TonB-dependent siderophore receptor [Bordetella genomosp. 12]|uniref:TonB-dependent siderophore receptor n=1 Tax=Bordetella genomosp. 12 TaxID=463035 RepID=A0A261VC93_9BORD|nr:TonB-dependent receptor [Bordetella genomosp. 12]OZI71625.1 TonB-dependent siderophore receptor [Bordetella genomosp. 12]